MAWFNLTISVIAALGVGGLIGSLLDSWLSNRAKTAKRRVEFRTRQLQDLYGPLLSLHKEIGTWTLGGGARHVSRSSLEAKYYFTTPEELDEQTKQAKILFRNLLALGATRR